MKLSIILIVLLVSAIAKAQKIPTVKGYRYERTIRNEQIKLSRYDSLGKKLYVIWRKEEIIAYPNPTSDLVYFSEVGDVYVSDISGRFYLKEKETDFIDLSNLKSGTYLITIITESTTSHHLEIKL